MLSLIEFQKIISAAAALSLGDFSGPVFLAGVVLLVVVVFFGAGAGVGLTTTWPPLPCGVIPEAAIFTGPPSESTAIALRWSAAMSKYLEATRFIFTLTSE